MKKLFTILAIFVFTTLSSNAGDYCNKRGFDNPPPPPQTRQDMAQREAAFEQRLGLTDEQKVKARNMREEGFQKIKPVIDNLKSREAEAEMVKRSKLSAKAQEEKLNYINSDIESLRKQAHDIRHENMKNFESILTAEQKKILKEMKQEGRQKYHENRSGMGKKY